MQKLGHQIVRPIAAFSKWLDINTKQLDLS